MFVGFLIAAPVAVYLVYLMIGMKVIGSSPCREEQVDTRTNPIGSAVAMTYKRECGGIDDVLFHVNISRYGDAPIANRQGIIDRGLVFRVIGHSNEPDLRLIWEGQRHLLIDCPNCSPSAAILEITTGWQDIAISYCLGKCSRDR
jgi:hypothetical protein